VINQGFLGGEMCHLQFISDEQLLKHPVEHSVSAEISFAHQILNIEASNFKEPASLGSKNVEMAPIG
jgi:hypothetical protein